MKIPSCRHKLIPPTAEQLYILANVAARHFQFDINTAEAPFTQFKSDDIDPMEWFDKAGPETDPDFPTAIVQELHKARRFVVDPPSQPLYELGTTFLSNYHKAFRGMYLTSLMYIDIDKLDSTSQAFYHDKVVREEEPGMTYVQIKELMCDYHHDKLALMIKGDTELFMQIMPRTYEAIRDRVLSWDQMESQLRLPVHLQPPEPIPLHTVVFPPYSPSSPPPSPVVMDMLSQTSTPDTVDVQGIGARKPRRKSAMRSSDIDKDLKKRKPATATGDIDDRTSKKKRTTKKPDDKDDKKKKSANKKPKSNEPPMTLTSKKEAPPKNTDAKKKQKSHPKETVTGTTAPEAASSNSDVLTLSNPVSAPGTVPTLDIIAESFPDLCDAPEKTQRIELGPTYSRPLLDGKVVHAEKDCSMKECRAFLRMFGKFSSKDKIKDFKPNKMQVSMHHFHGKQNVWRPMDLTTFPTNLFDMHVNACFGHIPPALNDPVVKYLFIC